MMTVNEELSDPIVKGQNTVWAEEELEKYKAAFKKLDPNFELQIVRHDDTGEICFSSLVAKKRKWYKNVLLPSY